MTTSSWNKRSLKICWHFSKKTRVYTHVFSLNIPGRSPQKKHSKIRKTLLISTIREQWQCAPKIGRKIIQSPATVSIYHKNVSASSIYQYVIEGENKKSTLSVEVSLVKNMTLRKANIKIRKIDEFATILFNRILRKEAL